jgi:hypothetical protein
MPRIVAYMDDLFFQMKLAETAKHLALEVKVASTAESLLQLLDPLPELVIVDLNARSPSGYRIFVSCTNGPGPAGASRRTR